MAKEQWYTVRIRGGFETVVIQKLRKLNLEVRIPKANSTLSRLPNRRKNERSYIYSRFDLRIQKLITDIPGVLDIVGTPDPSSTEQERIRSKGQGASSLLNPPVPDSNLSQTQ
jgi:hypothetical protein